MEGLLPLTVFYHILSRAEILILMIPCEYFLSRISFGVISKEYFVQPVTKISSLVVS